MSLDKVVENFLENRFAEKYCKLGLLLFSSFHALGCNVSVKICFFTVPSATSRKMLVYSSMEQVERFHQYMKTVPRTISTSLHQSIAASTWWCDFQPCLGWGKMAGLDPRSQLLWALPSYKPLFWPCCPLNGGRKAAFSLSRIGRLFFSCLSCPYSHSPFFDDLQSLSQPRSHLSLFSVR